MWDWVRGNMFTNDQITFMYGSFDSIKLLTNMASDYGVVPNPMLNTEQERYQCMIDPYVNFLCVPITNGDNAFTGAVLEYMAYVSRDTVREEYIETFLKYRQNRDEKMQAMVDIIFDSMHYEVSDLFALGIRDLIDAASGDGSLQSKYDGRKTIYAENVQALKDLFELLDELQKPITPDTDA